MENLLALSITLMMVGALSFVTPMFGRQFILVSLLDIFGIGATGAGLIFIGIGAYLFYKLKKLENQELYTYKKSPSDKLNSTPINNNNGPEKLNTGAFIFPKEGAAISTISYGYWSVRWSEKDASHLQEMIRDSKMGSTCTYMQSYLTYLQLVALGAASYWVFASFIGALPEHINAMEKGMKNRLLELEFEEKPLPHSLIETFDLFFKRYYQAIVNDVKNTENMDPMAVNFDISNLTKSFIETIEFYNFKNGKKLEAIEILFLGHLIDCQPTSVFYTLKEQGIYFNAASVPEL